MSGAHTVIRRLFKQILIIAWKLNARFPISIPPISGPTSFLDLIIPVKYMYWVVQVQRGVSLVK